VGLLLFYTYGTMVIPISGGMGPPLLGPPPLELERHFKIMKYCVWTMILSLMMQLVSGAMIPDVGAWKVITNSLNLLFILIVGIFLLRDDPMLGRAYQFLARTCCSICDQQCGGGMNCLMSFTFVCGFTVLWDLIFNGIIQFIVASLKMLFNPNEWPSSIYGFAATLFIFSKIATYVAEVIGAVYGFLAYRQARDFGVTAQQGGDSGGGGAGTAFRGGTAYPQAREDPSAPARESQPARNFQAFGGSGQRLGGQG